jgi:hypothetical protein
MSTSLRSALLCFLIVVGLACDANAFGRRRHCGCCYSSAGTQSFQPAQPGPTMTESNPVGHDHTATAGVGGESPKVGDPVTAEENRMFQEMYGSAGLDAALLRDVEAGWNNKTHAQRRADYDKHMKIVQEATEKATKEEEAKAAQKAKAEAAPPTN